MLTKAVGRFADLGLVSEQRDATPAGGRGQPALRLRVNDAAIVGIGINLSTRGLYLAAVDLNCAVLETVSRPPLASLDPSLVVPLVEDEVRRLLARESVAGVQCAGFAIAVRALIDRDERIEEITPSQRAVPYDALREALRHQFGLPVYFENFPQAFFEASQPDNRHNTIFHLILGYGIGGALAEGTRVYRGGFNQAANVGALMPETRPRPSLTDLADHLGIPVSELGNRRLEDMLAAADPRLEDWFESRVPAMAMPLSAVVQLFNPEAIVLGGEFPRPFYERMIPGIDLTIFDLEGRMPLRKPEIRVSLATGEAGRARSAASVPIARLLQ